jgi:hypothetical protein
MIQEDQKKCYNIVTVVTYVLILKEDLYATWQDNITPKYQESNKRFEK